MPDDGAPGSERPALRTGASFSVAVGSALISVASYVGFQRRANHHASRHQQLESTRSVAEGFAQLDNLQQEKGKLPKMP
jgi:hypothetical protein